MFSNTYNNKKVLITGNTGFKGSWLTVWLLKLGANIVGISKDIPTFPSMFEELNLKNKIKHYQEDIRNLPKITEIIASEKPDFVFHLAAQAIVSTSYTSPIETITSNVVGTTNILEALRVSNHKCIAIIITSDKAYDNIEQVWGYKEDDKMGGKDIYSGSKGAAELIIKSYYHSFFKSDKSNIKLVIGRAGNVIGGGDWAKDRIVVDCMEAWSKGQSVEIRSPQATRPWQHVLEPLSGYLNLAEKLFLEGVDFSESWNFGPSTNDVQTVQDVATKFISQWGSNTQINLENNSSQPHEATLLTLDCSKAANRLHWTPKMNTKDAIRITCDWYKMFNEGKSDMKLFSLDQIKSYQSVFIKR